MKLSTRSRYGTRMMLDLARHSDNGPVPIHDISRREDISVKYLEQIAIPLRKASLIRSIRGPHGGQLLARPPERITVGELVRVLEKEFALVPCVDNPSCCDRSKDCLTRSTWAEATRALYEKLDSVTLEDMLNTNGRIVE